MRLSNFRNSFGSKYAKTFIDTVTPRAPMFGCLLTTWPQLVNMCIDGVQSHETPISCVKMQAIRNLARHAADLMVCVCLLSRGDRRLFALTVIACSSNQWLMSKNLNTAKCASATLSRRVVSCKIVAVLKNVF
jgi:hypothetical protein